MSASSSGEAWGGDATGDVLVQIENLVGSQFDDALYGNNVANGIEAATAPICSTATAATTHSMAAGSVIG